MPSFFIEVRIPVKAGAGGRVDLATDDRPDSRFFRGFIKVNNPEHDPMVRNRQGIHAQFRSFFYQRFYASCSVKQAVFCVYMQMCKTHKPVSPASRACSNSASPSYSV